jgi:hypothetical protein
MKASFLADYIIACVAISSNLILINYICLSSFDKEIPAEMATLIFALASGALGAYTARDEQDLNVAVRYSFIDCVLMGLATTKVGLTLHYNLLLWGDGVVRKDLAPMIGGLATLILGVTSFRGTGNKKTHSS